MATLIQSLAISGSRKADGSPNAGGFVFLYVPGTTITTPGYRADDLSAAWPASGGGIQLDSAGKADIWVAQAVDIVVTDQSGTQLDYILGFNRTRAEQVEVLGNANFTGALTDPVSHSVTQAAGGRTDLNTILSRIATSLGGLDGQYKESAGATPRNLADVIRGIQVTPQDFGAKGDGKTDDTTAIQSALNEVKRLGGGVLYMPPGTYLVSAALALSNTNGIAIVGAGKTATAIKNTNSSGGVFALTTCKSFIFSRFNITHSGTTTGTAVSLLSTCQDMVLSEVGVDDVTKNGTHRICLAIGSGCNEITVDNCALWALGGDAAARGLVLTGTPNPAFDIFVSGTVVSGGSAGASIEYANTVGNVSLSGVRFYAAARSVIFTSFAVYKPNSIIGCPTLFGSGSSKDIDSTGVTADPFVAQYGNGVDGYLQGVLSGGTVTPDRLKGAEITIKGTTTGSAYVVAAPTPTPGTRNTRLTLKFWNAAGGAVTGWTLNAIYKVTGAIPTTDAHVITVELAWDADNAVWREAAARADTAL